MKSETKNNYDERVNAYISVYVDDICICHENPRIHMENNLGPVVMCTSPYGVY